MSRFTATNGYETLDTATLVKTLRDGVVQLLKCEARLLRLETVETLRRLARDVGLLAAGVVIAMLALITLTAALSVGVSFLLIQAVPPFVAWWLGPLLVATTLGVVAFALIKRGHRKLESRSLTPTATIATMKDNKKWIREKIS